MTPAPWQQRVVALAGLLQATHLVTSIARTGMVSQDVMAHSIRSIFVQNPDSIADVFCGTEGVKTGLRILGEVISHFDLKPHADLLRYTFAVIKLERNLANNPALLRELGARIANIDEQRMLRETGGQDPDEETIIALAGLYQATLSQISPQIKVSGKRNYLQNATNTARIRALLLAAVRAAVLWHQVGGRRSQLALARRQMRNALEHIT